MPEAQTLDNTPESIINPTKVSGKLEALVAKHFPKEGVAKNESTEAPAQVVETPVVSAETPATEAKVTPTETPPVVETPKENNYLEQKQKLIRRENELRKNSELLKKFKSEEPQYQEYLKNKGRLSKLDKIEKLAESNPTAALEELRISYDKLSQDIMNRNEKPKSQELLELENIKSEQIRLKQEIEEERNRTKYLENQKLINGFVHETKEEIKKQFDKYELINKNEYLDQIVELRAEAARIKGELPSVEQVADAVESQFEKQWVPSIYESKKLQNYFISKGWVKPGQALETKKPVVSPVKETRTLSNELTTGSTPSASARAKNREERLAELLRAHQA